MSQPRRNRKESRRAAITPNTGLPSADQPWATLHQSPLPWVNLIALVGIAERGR